MDRHDTGRQKVEKSGHLGFVWFWFGFFLVFVFILLMNNGSERKKAVELLEWEIWFMLWYLTESSAANRIAV